MEKTRSKAVTDCDNKTMLSYCLKCRKNTESKNPEVLNTKSGKTMLLSSYEVCANKKIQIHQRERNLWVVEKISY